MKRPEEISPPNILILRRKLAHAVLSRDTACLWDKFLRVMLKPGKCEMLSSVELGGKNYTIRIFSALRVSGVPTNKEDVHTRTESGEWFRRFWRSVSQRCLLQEAESMSKKIFHPKQCWFQTQEQQWTRNERRSYSGTQKQQQGKSTLLH